MTKPNRRSDRNYPLGVLLLFSIAPTTVFAAPNLGKAVEGLLVLTLVGVAYSTIASAVIAWTLGKMFLPSSFPSRRDLAKMAGAAAVLSLILFVPTKLVFQMFGDFNFGFGASLAVLTLWQLVVCLALVLKRRNATRSKKRFN